MSPSPVLSCFLITVLVGAALGDVVNDIAKVKLRARRNLVNADPLLYYLSKDITKAYMASDHKETWDSAKDMCRNMHGGRLAHIESETESKYLAEKFRIDDAGVYWLGLVKDGRNGGMFWEDASQWDGYDWGSGKEMRAPVDLDDSRRMKDEASRAPTNSCYALYPDQPNLSKKIVATWIELPCTDKYYFLCEVEAQTPVTFLPAPTAKELPYLSQVPNRLRNAFLMKFALLQDVLKRLANRRTTMEVATTTTAEEEEETEEEEPWRFCGKGIMYKVFDYALSYDDAVTECNTMGGRLAHIETKFEFDCVTESFSDYNAGSKYWIGLKTRFTKPQWEDGSKAQCPGCDLYWSDIPHETTVKQEMCYSAYYAYNRLVYQEEEDCSNRLPFMCQMKKATSSSSSSANKASRNQPWQTFSQAKKQYKAYSTPQNWRRATATCAKESGRLVQIQSAKEVKYLRDNMPSNSGEPYWIGLQKEGGAYKWNKPGKDVSYAVSKLANRKSEGDKDRCYMMWTEAPRNFPVKAGFLYGDDCQEKKSFICERDEKKEKKGKKNKKRK